MNSTKLKDKKVAILATDGFEQSELLEPKKQLTELGAKVEIISLEAGEIRGWDVDNWGGTVKVDKVLSEANPADFDALVLPGGLFNPDTLRNTPQAINFIKLFHGTNDNAPIAAICHGPWLLIETGLVTNCKLTSYRSIKTDLVNAGAQWVDQEVVVDKRIITSRKPEDLPAFIETIATHIN